jgi:hypothetical protein
VSGLAQEEHELVEVQVVKLGETIQQLQERIMELEISSSAEHPIGGVRPERGSRQECSRKD